MSSRLLTSRPRRSASSAMLSSRSCRVSGASLSPWTRSVEAAPVIEASGVRRSCETALRSELRICSVSIRMRAASAACWLRVRSIAMAVWFATLPEAEAARRECGLVVRHYGHDADGLSCARERKVDRPMRRPSTVFPGRLFAAVECPLSDRLLRRGNRQ